MSSWLWYLDTTPWHSLNNEDSIYIVNHSEYKAYLKTGFGAYTTHICMGLDKRQLICINQETKIKNKINKISSI